jgi:outer membrane receptor protein involved in Fe transport
MNEMHLQKFRVATLFAMVLLVAAGAFAQTGESGAIAGTVRQGGTALPGVTVEVRSSALQGVRSATTDAGGNFRFTLLPPGVYTLSAALSGFNTVTQNNVAVSLNKTVTLEVNLSPAASEQITVTGAAPVVDVTSNISGANVTSETMHSLPLGRNFVAAAQVAPGTSADAVGTTVYGSSGGENQYIIDGLNVTGVEKGLQGKRLNQDFIQEVDTLTGGLPAEYGRMTGGAIVAVTKSGSNEFHGDVFGYDSGGSFNSDPNKQVAQFPTSATTVGTVDKQFDYGVDGGGYIMKDRLWFFGAYDKVNETDISTRINVPLVVPGFTVPVGGTQPTAVKRDLYAAKLSLALTSSQLFNFSILGDPSSFNGAIFTIAGPPSTFLGTTKIGGNDYVGRYSGVFGTNWNVNAQLGRHKEKNLFTGPGATTSQLRDNTQNPAIRSGGVGLFQNQEFKRDTGKLDISSFWGNHQIKFGGDQENQLASFINTYAGGATLRKQCGGIRNSNNVPISVSAVNNQCAASGVKSGVAWSQGFVYYIHEGYVNTHSTTLNQSDPTTFSSNLLDALISAPKEQNTSLYVQDQWKMMPNLTFNVGVRWEEQKVGGADNSYHIDLKHNLAPRLGVIFDPANNGRSKVYANFGRFYESIPMDITNRTFGGELSLQVNNLDPTPRNFVPSPLAPALSSKGQFTFLGNTTPTPVDPALKGQYIDEYLVGYDYELASNLGVGIKGTYRNLGRVIEDMLNPNSKLGEYFITNPGSGTGSSMGFINYDPSNPDPAFVAPTPKAKRQYTGVELHAEKRFSNNYQFFTSYVWSRLKGNYDGTYQNSTGQNDPNINSAYDYGDFLINNSGLLSSDRTHVVKFYGSYTLGSGMAKGLDIGLATHWESGLPLTAYGYEHAGYRNWEYYLTTRGALGRGPSDYEADVHLGYPIPLGGSHLNLLFDVFNVFNRQSITALDNRFNLATDGACANVVNAAGKDICNGFGGVGNVPGTANAVGQLGNARTLATNPSFLKAGTSFTGVRSIRLGARWTF